LELSAAIFGLALACLFALTLTPIVVSFARRYELPHRSAAHKAPASCPEIGGLALLASVLLSTLAISLAYRQLGAPTYGLMRGIIAGGSLVAVLGLIDDLQGSRPWKKLLVQGLALLLLQTQSDVLGLELLGQGAALGVLAMLPWMIGLTNAMNMIDGIDGLAAGLAAISGVGLISLAWALGLPGAALPAAALVGAALGFLRSNGPPAKILMRATGSMFLGFVLSAVGATIFWHRPGGNTLLALFLISWVPCLDAGYAVLRRAVRQRNIFEADRGHLHHRLIERGLSPRYVSLLLCALGSVGAAAGVQVAQDRSRWPWALAVLTATMPLAWALSARTPRVVPHPEGSPATATR